MTKRGVFWAVLLSLSVAGCSSPSTDPEDSGTRADAPAIDSGTDPIDAGDVDGGTDTDAAPPGDSGMADAATSPDSGTMPACGTERPALRGAGGSEGLAIARDGTIYYSVSGGVGRIRPGMALEASWVTIQARATIWGMVLSADNASLYVGSPTTGSIHEVDTATGEVSVLAGRLGGPNGVTLGPDGAVYASDFNGDRVVRVDMAGMVTVVADTGLARPNGVAFLDSGELLVGSYMNGSIVALTLGRDHTETSRRMVASRLGAIDGLAVMADGTILATDQNMGRLIEVDGMGRATELLGDLRSPANIELGAGALNCTDVYVAIGGGLVRYEMGTRTQRAVPWH